MTLIRPARLRCEYALNPLGIDVVNPRFDWILESDRRGARQSAYQILVASSEAHLIQNLGDLWDSGKVESDQSSQIEYAGAPLQSAQKVYWRVLVWDEKGEKGAESELATWEMGLLSPTDWSAHWIGADLVGGVQTTVPAPYLRKTVAIDQPIVSARLYVTALGVYEFYCNGERVGSDVFAPGWTDYSKRVQYQTYDVTGFLCQGENAVGAILGDGWYCGHVEWRGRQRYGDRPRFLAQIVVELADGTTQKITTDGSWKTAFGPIIESDLLMGESYDARLELGAWNTVGYDDSRWRSVENFAAPDGVKRTASASPRVQNLKELTPISDPREIKGWPASNWLFDLGQNMVGRVRLKVSGPAGTTVTLRFGEILDAKGNLYTENLRSAKQIDHYTLKGDGLEIYESHFTFHGFRYVELVGLPEPATRETLTGIVLHSDTPFTGTFECSDPLVTQLQQNIQWGQRGNFVDIPTDCPQRDERLGWTGDAQVFIRTAAFNADVAGFFTKWIQDLEDAQSEKGEYPPVAPNTSVVGSDGGPAWADAGVICPWTIYRVYGDTRLLAERYESMTRFIGFLEFTQQNLIRPYIGYKGFHGFGDWLSTNAETPKELIGTAFFAHSVRLMSKIAQVLGKTGDAAKYAARFGEIRDAFIARYVTQEGLMAAGTQTAYVLALHFDLLPAEVRPAAADALVRDIQSRGTHLSTGFVGTPYLAHVLTEAGKLDVAYQLLLQKTWPSWLYPVTQGATTIWERWDGWTHDKGFQDKGMNSFNHYAYGAIGEWLYGVVAGIDLDSETPAYKHIVLRPRPGGGLTSARATYDSIHGHIESGWNIEGGTFTYQITVPTNTTATVYLPTSDMSTVREGDSPIADVSEVTFLRQEAGAAVYQVGSGRYRFTAVV